MTLRLPFIKPRNPLVAASVLRHAGSHRPSQAACRQKAQRALNRELRQLQLPQHHSP